MREFPGESYDHWKTTEPQERFAPGTVVCDSCEHEFVADQDNFRNDGQYPAVICDSCLWLGWPWRDEQ